MKKILAAVFIIGVFLAGNIYAQEASSPATAAPAAPMQTQAQPGAQQGMMKCPMQMCPMMKQITAQANLSREILQLLKETAQVQQRLVKGRMDKAQRKALLVELDKRIQKLDKMMNDMKAGSMQPAQQGAGGSTEKAPASPVHVH